MFNLRFFDMSPGLGLPPSIQSHSPLCITSRKRGQGAVRLYAYFSRSYKHAAESLILTSIFVYNKLCPHAGFAHVIHSAGARFSLVSTWVEVQFSLRWMAYAEHNLYKCSGWVKSYSLVRYGDNDNPQLEQQWMRQLPEHHTAYILQTLSLIQSVCQHALGPHIIILNSKCPGNVQVSLLK